MSPERKRGREKRLGSEKSESVALKKKPEKFIQKMPLSGIRGSVKILIESKS